MLPHTLIKYKFSILISLLIALVSLIPGNSLPETGFFHIPAFDKLVHFGMYALLMFTVLMEGRNHITGLRMHGLLILGFIILGGLIEVLQGTVVSYRSAEWMDLLADFSGLIAGTVSFHFFRWVIS